MKGWVGLAVAVAACGPAARPAAPDPPPVVAPPPSVDGAWTWREDTTADGVERSERESWHLSQTGATVRGYYDRQVLFRSVDGTPFACSQRPEYTLTTRYRVAGTVDGATVALAETAHEVVPSPCEAGRRGRTRYTGTVAANRFELRWPSGTQTLVRAGPAVAETPLLAPASAVAGEWRWRTHTPGRDEAEHWHLIESADGVITGHYEREITVRGHAGATLACNGATSYTLTARYEVRGTREARRVSIAELSADVADSPCELYAGERSLDSARGRVVGTALELVWRGDRRQVLHRPDANAPP